MTNDESGEQACREFNLKNAPMRPLKLECACGIKALRLNLLIKPCDFVSKFKRSALIPQAHSNFSGRIGAFFRLNSRHACSPLSSFVIRHSDFFVLAQNPLPAAIPTVL